MLDLDDLEELLEVIPDFLINGCRIGLVGAHAVIFTIGDKAKVILSLVSIMWACEEGLALFKSWVHHHNNHKKLKKEQLRIAGQKISDELKRKDHDDEHSTTSLKPI